MPTTIPSTEEVVPGTRTYRAFHLGQDGAIRSATVLDADTDTHARAIAATIANAFGILLWERARFLASFPPLSPQL